MDLCMSENLSGTPYLFPEAIFTREERKRVSYVLRRAITLLGKGGRRLEGRV